MLQSIFQDLKRNFERYTYGGRGMLYRCMGMYKGIPKIMHSAVAV